MPAPAAGFILPKIVKTAAGRIVGYRGTRGEVISKKAYNDLMRRLPTGVFTKTPVQTKAVENWFINQLGPRSDGKSWVRIAYKYRQKFEDYIKEAEQLFGV